MDRTLSPVFEKARELIESVLARHGFRLQTELLYHSAMGSGQLEYRHRTHWLRLHWDGKDHWLWLTGAISPDQHAHPGQQRWKPLDPVQDPPRFSQFLEPGPAADARIAELLDQIELFRASRAAV